jgi:hypothetical protein
MAKDKYSPEKLVTKAFKVHSLRQNNACKKMARKASKEQKQEMFKKGMIELRKTLKKMPAKRVWDGLNLQERMIRFKPSTRKKGRKCRYDKNLGFYINM